MQHASQTQKSPVTVSTNHAAGRAHRSFTSCPTSHRSTGFTEAPDVRGQRQDRVERLLAAPRVGRLHCGERVDLDRAERVQRVAEGPLRIRGAEGVIDLTADEQVQGGAKDGRRGERRSVRGIVGGHVNLIPIKFG